MGEYGNFMELHNVSTTICVALVATDEESGQGFKTKTKIPDDQSCRDNAGLGTILQVVQNHGEPRLPVNGDLLPKQRS